MRNALWISCALLAAGTTLASGQVRIEERGPAVVVPVPAPGVVVEPRDRERTVIERQDRAGCDSKTVRKETADSTTTIKKERCD